MRTTRYFRILRAVFGASVVGGALFADLSTRPPGHRADVVAIAAHSKSPSTTSAVPWRSPPGGAPGNLEVYVPPVPPQPVIQHLCQDLVSGTKPDPGAWLPDLVAITGGSVPATTSWCTQYLVIEQKRYGRG